MELLYSLIVLVFLLLILYYFSRLIIRYLSLISFLIFKNSKIGVYAYSIIFLPGILLHELSHFVTAAVLGVPTGRIEILPRKSATGFTRRPPAETPHLRSGAGETPFMNDEDWTLGAVESAQTDPLRSNLIGIAPLIFGCLGIATVTGAGLRLGNLSDLSNLGSAGGLKSGIFFYLLLCFSNNMFLSSEDRKSIWVLPAIAAGIGVLGYLSNLGSIGIVRGIAEPLEKGLFALDFSLGITAAVDIIFILPLALIIKLAKN